MQSSSVNSKQVFSSGKDTSRQDASRHNVGALAMAHKFLSKGMLLLATCTTFLSAGFFYAWQVGSIPGFRVMDDITYIQAMNAVNSNIRNAGFGFIFFGSVIFMVLTLLLHVRHWRTMKFLLVVAALVAYIFGLVAITFMVHVPLNTELLSYTDLTSVNVAMIRANYESRWNPWHLFRTIAVVISALLMLGAVWQASWDSQHIKDT